MPVLLHTTVLAELVRQHPEERVRAYVRGVEAPLISALTLHELTHEAERLPDPVERERLLLWVGGIRVRFGRRVVDVDAGIAEVAGLMRASAAGRGRAVDALDALIAASAVARGATVATRQVADYEALGVDVIDPWTDG